MISVEDKEHIRRAHFIEKKSIRQIERELHRDRRTIKKALANAGDEKYTLRQPRPSRVLGPWQTRIDTLLDESKKQPAKQRYTKHRIYELIQAEGYGGSESGVHSYIWKKRREQTHPNVFLPLSWEPGKDAQVDWGEVEVELAGERMTVQFFEMRACYSRKPFVRAYPNQKQEAFFDAHVEAFKFFGGVFERLTYDNLTAAVKQVLEGKNRIQQRAFIAFRSHYLIEARFCTPGEGHEKGGVENGIGYAKRNFFAPILSARDFDDLNARLRVLCEQQDERIVRGQSLTIGAAWQHEQGRLKALPERQFTCCATAELTLNGYSQVTFETNRYSVPAEQARRHLTLRAYPFKIEILDGHKVIATHPRCHKRDQDVFEPLHYLSLLEQRPGAFEHAIPMRQFRATWPTPPVYEQTLTRLQLHEDEGLGVREFVRILRLLALGEWTANELEAAMKEALAFNTVNRDAIQIILRQRRHPDPTLTVPTLDLAAFPQFPQLRDLQAVGQQAVNVHAYERLLVHAHANACACACTKGNGAEGFEGGNVNNAH